MATRADITPELCRQLLRYEPETGKLFWKPRPREMFKSLGSWKCWNSRHAGKEAITANSHSRGELCYKHGRLLGLDVWAHRIAWAVYHGEWPNIVDHIDGDGTNNRMENLRSVSHEINSRNIRMRRRNRSGIVGVSSCDGGWRARLKYKYREIYVGKFSTKREAEVALRAARESLGFHQNHGRPEQTVRPKHGRRAHGGEG